MTPRKHTPKEKDKSTQLIEEICEHTMAIRRVANRILDHLHEHHKQDEDYYDPDELRWEDMCEDDDMYY